MMKRLTILILALVLLLAACSGDPDSWQDYFDLGLRYLSDGNYQEAILEFTAAINIDPKQPEPYEKRGDAYCMAAEAEPENAAEYRSNALKDYETARDLTSGDTQQLDEKIETVTELLIPSATADIPDETIPAETVSAYSGYQVSYEQFVEFNDYPTNYPVPYDEYCTLTCTDPQGDILWVHESTHYHDMAPTEYWVCAVGQFEDRYYYISGGSLIALDIVSGNVLWINEFCKGYEIPSDAAYIDENGYVCLSTSGGPAFVVIAPSGIAVKYIESFGSDYVNGCYLEPADNQIAVHMMNPDTYSLEVFYVDIDWPGCSIIPQSLDEAIRYATALYNNLYQNDGTYVISAGECYDLGDEYMLTVRYQMSDEEAEQILANGGTPSANILVDTPSIDKTTGEISSKSGYEFG